MRCPVATAHVATISLTPKIPCGFRHGTLHCKLYSVLFG